MKPYRHWSSIACLVALCTAAVVEARAQAESYPNNPVRLISDAAPGSAIDTSLRIIADGLSQHWGQQVVVVNQPGASGAIAAKVAAEAAPDGYTLYAPALSVFLTVPGKAPNLPLELPRDFVAIGFTAEQPMAIGASKTLGVATLPELIALAKKRPGDISYAVSGIGRLTHLTGELLQMRGDIKLQMVPYSSTQSLSDVIAGRVPLVIEGYTGLAGAFQTGSLKALAIASAQRLPSSPDLPTFAETLPGFVATGWQVVVAPRGTREAIVNKVSEDLRAVVSKPEYKDKLAARGSYVRPMTPAQAVAFIHEQQRMWKPALDRIAQLTK
jgi:tripartite-type tricarboxylate transporter receptor subunit TctC